MRRTRSSKHQPPIDCQIYTPTRFPPPLLQSMPNLLKNGVLFVVMTLLIGKSEGFMPRSSFRQNIPFTTAFKQVQTSRYPSMYRRSVGRGDKNLHRTVGCSGSGSFLSQVSQVSSLAMQPSSFDTEDLLSVLEPGQTQGGLEGGFDYLLNRVAKCRDRENVEARMDQVRMTLTPLMHPPSSTPHPPLPFSPPSPPSQSPYSVLLHPLQPQLRLRGNSHHRGPSQLGPELPPRL